MTTATLTLDRPRFEAALVAIWPADVYDLPPDDAADALFHASVKYGEIALVLDAGTEEKAHVCWLRDACNSLARFKVLESISPQFARRMYEAWRDFVPAERPEHFALRAQ